MNRSCRWWPRLRQFLHRLSHPQPNPLAIHITSFKHLVRLLSCVYLGAIAVLFYEHIGGAVYVDAGGYELAKSGH